MGNDFVVEENGMSSDGNEFNDFGVVTQVFSTKGIDPETDTVILNIKMPSKMPMPVVYRQLQQFRETSAICKKLQSQDISFTVVPVFDDNVKQITPEVVKNKSEDEKSFDDTYDRAMSII